MKTLLKYFIAAVFFALPVQLFACAACGSASGQIDPDSTPLVNGMNLGILTLFAVIISVLGGIATFFVFIIRKSAALAAAAAENSAQPHRL